MSGELPPLLVVSPLEEVLPNSSGLFSKDQGSGQDGTITGFTGSWRGRRNGSWETEELDGVGPVDNRLSTDKLHNFVNEK